VRKRPIKKFADQYTFEKPTMQLVRYRANAGMQANMVCQVLALAFRPKLPAKAGDCCGGSKKTQ